MSENVQYPWLFKGAYAIYKGATKVAPLPGTFDVTVKIEVKDIDLANQQVKLHISSTIVQQIWRLRKKVSEKEHEGWIKIGERVLPSATPMILDAEYEGILNIENLGVRTCIIQQWHELKKRKRIVSSCEILFWDKEFNWPIRYMLVFNYKTKYPEGLFLGTVKDSLRSVIKSLERAIETGSLGELMTMEETVNRNEFLKEASLILYLKETNIPGLK